MAQSIATPAVQIKRRFCKLLPDQVIVDACLQAGHRWRRRKFDPVVTIHLFIFQVLHGNTAILHLRHLARCAINAAAYCRARRRIPRSHRPPSWRRKEPRPACRGRALP